MNRNTECARWMKQWLTDLQFQGAKVNILGQIEQYKTSQFYLFCWKVVKNCGRIIGPNLRVGVGSLFLVPLSKNSNNLSVYCNSVGLKAH